MRRYWHCQKCGTRNERAGGRKSCAGCGKAAPKVRVPKHQEVLRDNSFEYFAQVNQEAHGFDENTCAICGGEGRSGINLQREHAHHDGGYPRGLAHALCNKALGEVERGRDAEAWLESALAFVRRARLWHESQVSV